MIRSKTLTPFFAVICSLIVLGGSGKSAAESPKDFILVKKGVPPATIVTADKPSPVAALAAKELATHLEKATGVRFEVAGESQVSKTDGSRKIYIGQTNAAFQHGLAPQDLPKDVFRLKASGADLFICGSEDGEAVGPRGFNGTLYGVYEVMDRYLHVRWLWPGELGTYLPSTERVVVPAQLDETIAPVFGFRIFRVNHITKRLKDYPSKIERMGFSAPVLRQYADDLDAYLLRHRMGRTTGKPDVGHYFSDWWNRYGEEHPDWFMMREDGGRGPLPDASKIDKTRVAMNVANQELHRFILEEAWDGGNRLRLGEVDRRVYCLSPESLAWDVPPQEPIPRFAINLYRPAVSDRYARFWQTIQDEAVKRNPDVLITTFLYFNYLPAPVKEYHLKNVYGEYVPWGAPAVVYYPMSEEAHAWNKKQWKGWAATGMKMAYRPNYLLGGYIMPHLSTWQAADMFQFVAKNGMIGFDFDALWGQWAVKGPMYYIHMRLVKDPAADVKVLREEYFSAFGPAASDVEAYFDYWEEYSAVKARNGGVNWSDPTNAHTLYPREALETAQTFLDDAKKSASKSADPQFLARVEFLATGLEHARLSAEFIGSLGFKGAVPTDPERISAAQEAVKRLIKFRRQHEKEYFSDLVAASAIENWRIDIEGLLGMNPEDASGDSDIPGEILKGEWVFRKDPDNRGVREKWFVTDGEGPPNDPKVWQPVLVPSHLANTAVGDHVGHGWYQTTFEVPESWRGQDLRVCFRAVDEEAWVYVNGEYVGEHTVASEKRPVGELYQEAFAINVPAGLLRTDRNQLVVRIHSNAGASGIWGPVSIVSADDL